MEKEVFKLREDGKREFPDRESRDLCILRGLKRDLIYLRGLSGTLSGDKEIIDEMVIDVNMLMK